MKGVWILGVIAFAVCVIAWPFGSTGLPSVSQVSFDACDAGVSAARTVRNPMVRRLLWPLTEATAALDVALAR